MHHRLLPLGVTLAVLSACGGGSGGDSIGPPVGPTVGSLFIGVTKAGIGQDTDGVQITVDALPPVSLSLPGSFRLDSVTPGAHSVTLAGLEPNCRLSGSASRQPTIAAGDSVTVAFALDCFRPFVNEILFNSNGVIKGVAPTNGGVPRFVYQPATKNVDFPVASPDGLHFAVTQDVGGSINLAVVEPDGTGLRTLVSGCGNQPAWSPDGQAIAYSCPDTAGADIWVVDVATGARTNLTNTVGAFEEQPSWSPDGQHIAFEGNNIGGGLYIMDANGANRHQLTTTSSDEQAAWSPLGDRIAFTRVTGAQSREVYTVDTSGTGEAPVTSAGWDWMPTWSPDGSRIAFVRILPADWELFAVNADGTNEIHMAIGVQASNPHWSH